LLAAVCLIQETSIIVDGERLDCLEIESLTNSPWNTIDYPQVEKRKGAATSLIEGIVRESQQMKNVKELLDPNFFQNRLEEVRAYKQKLLKKVASAEEYEGVLIEAIERKKHIYATLILCLSYCYL
jgi:hypothetical protein